MTTVLPDHLWNITDWMYRCANSIAEMKFRPESYEHDVALMIAKHLPAVYRKNTPKIVIPIEVKKAAKSAAEREYRKLRVANNVCVQCGGHKEQPAKKMCDRHLEDDRRRHNTRAE